MGQSGNLVAMIDPEFFKTLERHRPDPVLAPGPPRRFVTIEADLRRWSFDQADLSCSDFPGCDFSSCSMREVDLYAANCVAAQFVGADLGGAWLAKADFAHADFTNAKLWRVRAMRAAFHNAVFVGAEFVSAELAKASFSSANLRGARLICCDLARCVLDGAKVRDLDLSGSTGLDSIVCEELDIGTGEVPEILSGISARRWLTAKAAASSEKAGRSP